MTCNRRGALDCTHVDLPTRFVIEPLFFNEGDTGTEGYRCVRCGCTFIVLKKGVIPEPEEDDDEEHTKDRWPY